MNDEKTVAVSLRDLCDISAAVSGMMHDLDNDDMDHPYVRIDVIHVIVEGWVSDGAVLGGGCHPNHRCWLCTDDPGYFEWIRSRMQDAPQGPRRGADRRTLRTPGDGRDKYLRSPG